MLLVFEVKKGPVKTKTFERGQVMKPKLKVKLSVLIPLCWMILVLAQGNSVAQLRPGNGSEPELQVRIVFEDGRTVTLRPAQIVDGEGNPIDEIRLVWNETVLGVTREGKKILPTKRIGTIEYRKNRLPSEPSWTCLAIVYLTDGPVVPFNSGTAFTLADSAGSIKELSEENRQYLERLKLSSEFSGYWIMHEKGEESDEVGAVIGGHGGEYPQLTGEVAGGRFQFDRGEHLFSCPYVSDDSAKNQILSIRKVEFRWSKPESGENRPLKANGVAQAKKQIPLAQDTQATRDKQGLLVGRVGLIEDMKTSLVAALNLAFDPPNTKLLEVRVSFPGGRTYSTKDLALEYRLGDTVRREECGGHGYGLPYPLWKMARDKDNGVRSPVDFTLEGQDEEVRLIFAVPKEIVQASLLYKGSAVGKSFDLPLPRH
jgi:hypothetical protein